MGNKINITDFAYYEANKNLAETFLETDWASILTADQTTWYDNSIFNTPSETKDPTGFFMYQHYYMKSFGSGTNSNVAYFATTTLGAGSGNDYTNRATRTWSTT